MLSNKAITKYREIYHKQCGVEISEEEAAEQAQRLLNLARVVMQPMPKRFEARYNKLLNEHLDNPRMSTLMPRRGSSSPRTTHRGEVISESS